MKKSMLLLTLSVAVAFTGVGFLGSAQAIQGECVNCHTMHNSQDGATLARAYNPETGEVEDSATALAVLLNADCIACHAGTVAETNDQVNSFGAPIVLRTSDPAGQGGTDTLAGGDFYWVGKNLGADDTAGHNVVGVSDPDTNFPDQRTPPGFDIAATPGVLGDGTMNGGVATWSNQLRCSGLYGCHGNHTDADPLDALSGAHHANPDLAATVADDPGTIGESFRFLGGINGMEDVNWNWGEDASTHNEYYGVSENLNYANKRTISYLCAQCHGVFHEDIRNVDDAWIRHPTDIPLTNGGEYAAYTSYSVEAPVARPTVYSASNSTVTPGTDIVNCLSCHRAHGSDQPDLLRWDYTTMVAGNGSADTGCFTCHTEKNDTP